MTEWASHVLQSDYSGLLHAAFPSKNLRAESSDGIFLDFKAKVKAGATSWARPARLFLGVLRLTCFPIFIEVFSSVGFAQNSPISSVYDAIMKNTNLVLGSVTT